MKILFNNKIFFDQKYGGISRYFKSIFEIFIEKNINFKVIAPIYKNLYLKNLDNSFKEGLYVPRYPLNSQLEKLNNFIANKLINNHNFDILHDTFYSKDIYKVKNKKRIITIHDLIHEKYPSYYDTKSIIDLRKKLFENMDHFICVSNSTKEDLLNYYSIPEEKVKVIYHGSDHLDKISINLKNKKFEFRKRIIKPFILYVGKRYRYKNFKILINSFKNSSIINNDFQIVFFGGEKINKKEAQMYENLDLRDKIIHLSGDDEVLKYLYQSAKIMVSTSEYEGFGLNILEALKYNCPVVARDIKVFRELYDNNIFYFKNDESLKYILEETLISNKIKINSKNESLALIKKLNWESTSDQMIEVYKSI